ncbi:MAG: hypothetical protein M3O34_12995 [Chloroflexota bacterium]|nr:hypothetical protein [Chloroflexota bacterium]
MATMETMTSGRWAGAAATVGGLLWLPYGVFEMLEPWGAATVYREGVGYELIIDVPRFVAYSLPGGLALLLTSLGLLGAIARLRLPPGRGGRSGGIERGLASVALGLAALSLAGVAARFDPLFTVGLIFGTLALGAAASLAGVAARRAGVAPAWTAALLTLGLMGLLVLPLWPLVYAVALVPPGAGAAFLALFGLGWMALGCALWSGRGE